MDDVTTPKNEMIVSKWEFFDTIKKNRFFIRTINIKDMTVNEYEVSAKFTSRNNIYDWVDVITLERFRKIYKYYLHNNESNR